MTQPNLLNLAKQGDTRALTNLLNRSLQPRGISAKATRRNENLHILLEGQETPNQGASVRCIQQGLEKLELVDTPVTIYGREQGQTTIAWQEHLSAPITSPKVDSFFDAELLEDGDASGSLSEEASSEAIAPDLSTGLPTGAEISGDLTGGEPTEVSEDWSDQATAIEAMDPLPPQAPPPPAMPEVASNSWDNFDLDGKPEATPDISQTTTGFEPPDDSWGTGIPVDYSPEDPEPTLIVPDEGEDEMEAALNEEDADSEILLSLWDDANLDDDIEPSGDISVDNLELWQEGETPDAAGSDTTVLSDEPMLVGDPSSSSAKSRQKGSSCLPLLLLGLLALLGGIATAAHLRFLNVPMLAKIPGVGPFLAPGANPPATNPASGEVAVSPPETSPSEETESATSAPSGSGNDPQEASNTKAPKAVESTTITEGSGTTPESTTPEVSQTTDAFRDAVNAATQASTLAQTAATSEDWSLVAEYWGKAVDNMKAVPSDNPKYDVAQEKVPEYQRYLDYAQQQI